MPRPVNSSTPKKKTLGPKYTIGVEPESAGAVSKHYLRELFSKSSEWDAAYGPKANPTDNTFTLGRQPLRVDESNDEILIGDRVYKGSVGLYELIFKAHPSNVTEEDERTYAEIMRQTGLHLNVLDRVKPNRGEKYLKYIKVLKDLAPGDSKDLAPSTGDSFHDANDTLSGAGLLRSHYSGERVRLVYWDDPNELVERLELLVGEREAGHGGLENEIISILDELKERGFITKSRRSSLYPAF